MKKYGVEVAFYSGEDKPLCLYHKYYPIYADSEEQAIANVKNILSIMEFHNFEVTNVKEIAKELASEKHTKLKGCLVCGCNLAEVTIDSDVYERLTAEGIFRCHWCGSEFHVKGHTAKEVIDRWNNYPR